MIFRHIIEMDVRGRVLCSFCYVFSLVHRSLTQNNNNQNQTSYKKSQRHIPVFLFQHCSHKINSFFFFFNYFLSIQFRKEKKTNLLYIFKYLQINLHKLKIDLIRMTHRGIDDNSQILFHSLKKFSSQHSDKLLFHILCYLIFHTPPNKYTQLSSK